MVMWHLDSLCNVGDHFHPQGVVFICGLSFSFVFVGGLCQAAGSHFHPWVVVWVLGQLFGVMGSHWYLWVVGFIVAHCWHWVPCGGCCPRRCVVAVVVVDGRKEECHIVTLF